jgi:hypothetical protein
MRYLKMLLVFFAMKPINTLQAQQPLKSKTASDTVVNCGCPKLESVNSGYRYYNTLKDYLSYKTFADMSNWILAGQEESFDYLFTSGGQISDYRSDFSILSPRRPIRMVSPDKTFTINFTPCKNSNGIYQLPLVLYFKHHIMDEVRDFDFTKFDHTALAYVSLLLKLADKRPDQMIRLALKEQSEHLNGMAEMNRSITAINEAYQTGIPLTTKENYQDSIVIEGVMNSLVTKKLRQANVLTTGFILSASGIHAINTVEYDRLYELFLSYVGSLPGSIENFEKEVIRPDIYLSLDIKNTEIEISRAIIQQESGNQAMTKIFADIKTTRQTSTNYTSRDGLKMDFNNICFPHSVITGTHIAIDFNQASLLTCHQQNIEQIDYSLYPQLVKTVPVKKNDISKSASSQAIHYDTLLTEFTGLLIKNASFNIPLGKEMLIVNASNIILNNKLIAGSIIFEILSDKMAEIRLVNGRTKKIQIVELLSALKKIGLPNIKTSVIKKQLFVYFEKKTVDKGIVLQKKSIN